MPDAFAQRMQKLMPFLMTVRHGAGIPFLLPLLLQVLGSSEESRPATQAAWLHVLMDQKVGVSFILRLLQDAAMCLRDVRHTEVAKMSLYVDRPNPGTARVARDDGKSLVALLQAMVAGAILKRAAAVAVDAAATLEEAASDGASLELSGDLVMQERALLMCCQVLTNMFSTM